MCMVRPLRLTGLQTALLIAGLLALLVRAAIPAGYMPERQSTGWLVTLCTGDGVKTVTVDVNGKPVKHDGSADAAPSICAFASLAAPALSAAPPLLLILAIAFILLRGLVPTIQPARRVAARLRPPLRAPPAR